jgi:hypothetical protein
MYGMAQTEEQRFQVKLERPLSDIVGQHSALATRIVIRTLADLELSPQAKVALLHYYSLDESAMPNQSLREEADRLNLSKDALARARLELLQEGFINIWRPSRKEQPARIIVKDKFTNTVREKMVSQMVSQYETPMGQSSPRDTHEKNDLSLVRSFSKDQENLPPPPPLARLFAAFDVAESEVEGQGRDEYLSILSPVAARSSGPRFRLTPGTGSGKHTAPKLPEWAIQWVLRNCFGIDDLRHVTKRMRQTARATVQELVDMKANLARLDEFGDWWTSWARSTPTANQLVKYWFRAMKEVDRAKSELHANTHETKAPQPSSDEIQAMLIQKSIEELEELGQHVPKWRRDHLAYIKARIRGEVE